MKFIKNLLNFIQIVSVFMIPIAACYQLLPQLTFIQFIAPFNAAAISIFSAFIPAAMQGTDWTLLLVALPWVLYIIFTGFMMKMVDGLNQNVEDALMTSKKKKIAELNIANEQKISQELEKKQFTYVAIHLVFSKFTISYLTEDELEEKKRKIRADLLSDLLSLRGKVIEDEEFEDDDIFALMFFSQDDALNFVLKLQERIKIIDMDIQDIGYSIGYKAMLDVQQPEAITFYILQFLERALKTVELNEICTTNNFAKRYKLFGKVTSFDFTSKGNYSINKERIELKKFEY